jgi:WhiB family redox-sensing transcriptional regulator
MSEPIDRLYEQVRSVVVARATQEWRDHAACRGKGADLFFTERGANSRIAEAQALCASCPVQAECHDYAVEAGERFGVWGGSGATRLKVRRAERRRVGVG